jgi:hypothetical protein
MLKIPAVYRTDTSPAKLTDIYYQVFSVSLQVSLLVLARELWWMNQE